MKITSSNLLFNQNTNKQQTAARVINSSVSIQSPTQSTTASIKQAQLIEALSLINSTSMSLIKDADGHFQVTQNTHAIESITRLALEEEITVTALSSVGQTNSRLVGVDINRVFAFESNTNIQMNTLGKVTTEDGREIDFLLELNYQRDMQVTQTSQFSGHRDLIDPLVINLTGGPAQLSDSYFEFDLNGDGNNETLHQTATGTGFLVFDKNDNGLIDDGSEMFGPQTGYGFAELSVYDEDGNGWIDENDSIFSQLSFMDFDDNGAQRLQDLSTVGLGAIALQSAAMDFDLYDTHGNFQAQVARSGVALMENGAAVSIQEIYYPGQAFGQGRLERTQEIDVNNSGNITQNASPLTQFQFNNAIVNERNEGTHVSLDLPTYSNRVAFDTYQEVDLNLSATPVTPQQDAASQNITDTTAQGITIVSAKQSEQTHTLNKRSAVQNYFQSKIQADRQHFTSNPTPISQENHERIQVNDLTQSVSWDYNESFFSKENTADKKIEDLKLLVENLKIIRERQIKMQEKLNIYHEIDQLKGAQ
ncbi:MAG: hypothetical protein ACI8SR_003317 [Oceanicoccus sp.]|jgi:hypothetical protein